MTRYWLLCIVIASVVLLVAEAQNLQTVSDSAVNAAIRSPRYMRRQINCLLGETNCDQIGQQLKRATPALLQGKCPGCSEQQHAQANRVLTAVSQQYPQEYSRIYFMYGPRAQRQAGK